jgi:acyl-CoA synthetase (AMP-forming)/AMP-acid ligase II
MRDANYATFWEHVATALPDRPAAYHGERTLTWRELDRNAGRLAAAWREGGVGPGAKVACYLFNSPEYLEAVFAALKLDAVPVNVNYRYQRSELVGLLTDARAEVLVLDGALAGRAEDAAREVGTLRQIVQVGEEPLLDGAARPEDLRAAHEPVEHALRGGDGAIFMYTGGTTGLPKGVVWRQRDLFASQSPRFYRDLADAPVPETYEEGVALARRLAEAGAAPRTLPIAPLMHATALFSVMAGMLVGGAAVFTTGRSFDPARVWRTVQERRVTRLIVAGNAIARPLADELRRGDYDIGSVDSMFSSGVAWTDDVKRTFLERKPMRLVEVLASSEGGPYAVAEVGRVEDLPSRFVLTPGGMVLDEDGNEIEPGSNRIGVLAFSGPMPQGYHDDPAKTAEVFRTLRGRRIVSPGDLVRLRADRSVEFLGRGSGVVNSGGEKVYPAEVEDVLRDHPGVDDCVIVGIPDDRWGEVVAAVVAPASESAEPQTLIDHVAARLAGYKKPRHVVIVDALPRGPNAKVDLNAARDLAIRALTGPPGQV